jgi:hypothetical protein
MFGKMRGKMRGKKEEREKESLEILRDGSMPVLFW